MGEIVKLPQTDQRLWEAFLQAKENAIVSGDYEEARKARELWMKFLEAGEKRK